MATNTVPLTVGGMSGQSGRFYTLFLVVNGGQRIAIGGLQSLNYNESTGVQGWIGEVGSDHKEPQFQMRQVSGSIDRLILNRRKLRDIFAGGDSSNVDLDFRQYQLQIELDYQEDFSSVQGTPVPTTNGVFKEFIDGVMFTNLTFNLSDPTTLSRESVNFIGKQVGIGQFSEAEVTPDPTGANVSF